MDWEALQNLNSARSIVASTVFKGQAIPENDRLLLQRALRVLDEVVPADDRLLVLEALQEIQAV